MMIFYEMFQQKDDTLVICEQRRENVVTRTKHICCRYLINVPIKTTQRDNINLICFVSIKARDKIVHFCGISGNPVDNFSI